MNLYPERFACAVRACHPAAAEWGLEAYCASPHVLITLSDHTSRDPTWVDEALAKLGRARRVAWRTRSFLSAPIPERFDLDPAHMWLRERLARAGARIAATVAA